MSRPRKVHVKSFGCQMNVYDSHRMADTLAPAGFSETAQAGRRRPRHPQHLQHPRKGGREGLFRDRPHPRAEGGGRARKAASMLIAVAGCVAQAEGAGNHPPRRRGRSGGRLAELSPAARTARARANAASRSSIPNFRSKTNSTRWPRRAAKQSRKRGISAFVTVQEGCDKFCTFCVVPYTRGAEVSRPVEKIAAEVERLAQAGVREVTLIGQNVNAYHGQGADGRACDARPIAAPSRRGARHRAAALHDQPSARHGRRPDRRAWRSAGADALCASAGAIRFRPHSGGDEPQAYAQGLSRRDRAAARARAPISLSPPISSSAFRAKPKTISATR